MGARLRRGGGIGGGWRRGKPPPPLSLTRATGSAASRVVPSALPAPAPQSLFFADRPRVPPAIAACFSCAAAPHAVPPRARAPALRDSTPVPDANPARRHLSSDAPSPLHSPP